MKKSYLVFFWAAQLLCFVSCRQTTTELNNAYIVENHGVDSLIYQCWQTGDTACYRAIHDSLSGKDELLTYSILFANKYEFPLAHYDVYASLMELSVEYKFDLDSLSILFAYGHLKKSGYNKPDLNILRSNHQEDSIAYYRRYRYKMVNKTNCDCITSADSIFASCKGPATEERFTEVVQKGWLDNNPQQWGNIRSNCCEREDELLPYCIMYASRYKIPETQALIYVSLIYQSIAFDFQLDSLTTEYAIGQLIKTEYTNAPWINLTLSRFYYEGIYVKSDSVKAMKYFDKYFEPINDGEKINSEIKRRCFEEEVLDHRKEIEKFRNKNRFNTDSDESTTLWYRI